MHVGSTLVFWYNVVWCLVRFAPQRLHGSATHSSVPAVRDVPPGAKQCASERTHAGEEGIAFTYEHR